MKTAVLITLLASLGVGGAAFAQPSGGPDAKGNAPLKAPHSVNDGAPKAGANSFTEGQARQHILNSGYSAVSGLSKGSDGVWRGTATKDGASIPVALDFKGAVTEGVAMVHRTTARRAVARSSETAAVAAGAAPAEGGDQSTTTTTTETSHRTRHARHHHGRRHGHHHRRHHVAETTDGSNSGGIVAASGIDRDHNGISDKEDRAHQDRP